MSYLNFSCDIKVEDNPLDLNINDYLQVGIRNNPKRRFLFVSKPLGKHLACNPKEMDELGKSIVQVYNSKNKDSKNEKGTIISFAETGTALGHSVFDYLEGDYEFIHTTREIVKEYKSLEFLEEHSHATDQNLYFENLKNLQNGDSVLLIDDEITTANTCVNIIKKIQNLYPKKRYTICSILNWVNEESLEKIKNVEKELNCSIDFVYLFKGNFDFKIDKEVDYKEVKELKVIEKKLRINYINLDMKDYISNKRYIKYTGRFGMNKKDQKNLISLIKKEKNKLVIQNKEENILVLGTEEFMYIPMMFAKQMEGNVYYHSITRSPIIEIENENYPINSKFKLNSFYNEEVSNYVYNIDKNNYKECFLFVELNKDKKSYEKIINIFKSTNIEKLNIVCCN